MNKLLLSLMISLGMTGAVQAAEGDAAAGQAKAAACVACHGADGNSPAPTFPKLAGQNPSYIVKQLKDIKEGARTAPVMIPFANMIGTEQARADVAAFYASQEPKKGPEGAPELLAKGKEIYHSGLIDKAIPACTACHGPDGNGNNLAVFPQLKYQHAMYTEQQLKAFRDGTRTNDPGAMMQDIAGKMSDEEIKAVAASIQSM